jgi:D-3-phosphoglycerate dehydrogenase
MARPKILVFAPLAGTEPIIDALAARGYVIVRGDERWQQPGQGKSSEIAAAARGAVALMGTSIRATPITREVLLASPHLRTVTKYSIGVDDVDVDAATELGILVCHAPTEDNCFAVAESTVALMLALLKKVRERDEDVRSGKWRERRHAATYLGARSSDNYPGITVGVIGLGRIGTRVTQLLAPWRLRVIAYDPYVPPMAFMLAGVERVDYDGLLERADVVSFHVPLTAETRYMFGAHEIRLMKPSAILLNTARGKIIEEDAVATALREGRLAGAAIDAFEEEPLPMNSPLRDVGRNLILSPHATAMTDTAELRAGAEWAGRSVHVALSGRVPDNVYNKDAIALWKKRFGGKDLSST